MIPGPNDVIALEALGIPTVALCATSVTSEQAEKIGNFAGQGASQSALECLYRKITSLGRFDLGYAAGTLHNTLSSSR